MVGRPSAPRRRSAALRRLPYARHHRRIHRTVYGRELRQLAAHAVRRHATVHVLHQLGVAAAGMTMTSGGLISGTPTTKGEYLVCITVTDSVGCHVTTRSRGARKFAPTFEKQKPKARSESRSTAAKKSSSS